MEKLSLDDLMTMNSVELRDQMNKGFPLDLEVLGEGRQYLGVDLSLPDVARKILWHTFRKTFVRDGTDVRGWNVRMEQTGVDSQQRPMKNRDGSPKIFGHYRVRETAPETFKGWHGAHHLDYDVRENPFWDLARFGCTPLVAVNAGSQDLLLGWEIVRLGPSKLQLPLFWALRFDGLLEDYSSSQTP